MSLQELVHTQKMNALSPGKEGFGRDKEMGLSVELLSRMVR